jgi:ubiquinone/menaquinone biosynthesis C-methylase UbiE
MAVSCATMPAAMASDALVTGTYTRAADTFDSLPFWHHYGRRTVEAAGLRPGARVVDLCCGTGASALPAAAAGGPHGEVIGVDLTPALVDVARRKAAARGLTQARFVVGDVAAFTPPVVPVDAVICVFGLFFVDDMAGLLGRAWSWLAPGGRLAITSWGETVLSPGETYFWEAVLAEDPTRDHISPSDRLATPAALRALFAAAGLPEPRIVTERWRMPLPSAEAFWPVILGTSNRGVLEALPLEARARVRAAVTERLRREAATGLDMEAHVAVVVRA